jgi:diguanylate cyclase (GGDEF)-like protein
VKFLWPIVLLALNVAIAAPKAAAPESPRFAHLSLDDGLSQSSVQNILQDRQGLMWFGTQEGLNRYDGYRFTIHRTREQDGFLRDHDITAMVEDPDGDLWVGTSRGLHRYDLDTGRFDSIAPPVNQLEIVKVIASGDGRIYFAASDGQLWTLDRGDTERRARPLNDGAYASLRDVTALAAGEGGAVWAAAQGKLFKVDLSAGTARELLRDLGAVSVLARDQQNNVWIGRADGELLRYRSSGGAVDRFPQVPGRTLAILPAKSGEIWIGARRGGLTRLDPTTGATAVYRHDPDESSSLLADDVAAIYEDAAGNLWIGTWNGGVDRFDPDAQALRTLRPRADDGMPVTDVTSMHETPDGALWLASRSGLLMTGDPKSGLFRTVATLPPKGGVFGLGSWNGRILAGMAGGLVAFDAATGREVPLDRALQAHRLSERRIAGIRTGRDSAWIAAGKDVLRLTPGNRDAGVGNRDPWIVEQLALPIEAPVSALSSVGDGRIWIGSENADVFRIEWTSASARATVVPLQVNQAARDSLVANRPISSIHEDRQGRLWIGTRRGLGRVDPSGTVSWLGVADGLQSTDVAGIAPDADGLLWIGHNRGLTRLDPATGALMHFGQREGAQGKGYVEGAWAIGASGVIYFAGQGVTAFDPRAVRISSTHPRIVFTALEVLHRAVEPDWLDPQSPLQRTLDRQEEVTLGPDATVFSVEMAPLHYIDPSSNRLMYRLEGFDREWIETSAHNRVATYTNLAPGRYLLRARAGTKNGVWSERDATLAIRILPPWWRTTPALAAWMVASVGAISLVWFGLQRRAKTKLALLERETLRRESLTDPLTGLHNRRFLVTHLQHEVPSVLREYRELGPAAAETGNDLLLLLIDVDNFKAINDRFSHTAGDRVLTRIAATLEQQTRDSDLAVRWGGDEFLIVTRSFRRASGADYAERLRSAVEALGKKQADEGGPACTVSIGFAAFPFVPGAPDALTWEKTLELADHALRMTKERKRNSCTGLIAGADVNAREVIAFLDGGDTLPSSIHVLSS